MCQFHQSYRIDDSTFALYRDNLALEVHCRAWCDIYRGLGRLDDAEKNRNQADRLAEATAVMEKAHPELRSEHRDDIIRMTGKIYVNFQTPTKQ